MSGPDDHGGTGHHAPHLRLDVPGSACHAWSLRPGLGALGRVVLSDVVDDRAAGGLRGRLGPRHEPRWAIDHAVRPGRRFGYLGLRRLDRIRLAVLAYPLGRCRDRDT